MTLPAQLLVLAVLAIPVACISWTVIHEEVTREPREWCQHMSRHARHALVRKFFYLFTCEYCFSHYVTAAVLVATRFTLVYGGWRGYVIAFFSMVWLANVYMSLFGRLRLTIKHERTEIAAVESQIGAANKRGKIAERRETR